MSDRNTRADSEGRSTRAGEQRQLTESRDISDSERLRSFRHHRAQGELPELPKIDGYDTFYATTTNPRDTIAGRLAIGYELIRAEEVPGFEHVSIKTGEYAGCIGVNEMIAMKIPSRLKKMYMQEAHHDAPMRNTQGIYEQIESMQAEARDRKGDVEVGDGFRKLADTRTAQFDN